MNGFELQKPEYLFLLPIALAFAAMLAARTALVRRDIERFSGAEAALPRGITALLSGLSRLETAKILLLTLATASIVLALARPTWGKTPKTLIKEGHDIVFVLDVSNSMSSRDLTPTRLERCKLWIKDCLSDFKGHRVGLVIFAGSASIKAPLTRDYDFLRSTLDKVDRWSVSQGGTRLGDALLKTCDKIFSDKNPGPRDIIVFTDGGTQDKDHSKALKAVNRKRVKLIVVGVGDAAKGARVPSPFGKGFMRYKNKFVTSRLKSDVLRGIIHECEDGAYLPVGTGNMDLAGIYRRLADKRMVKQPGGERTMVPNEIFQAFVALALLLLGVLAVLPPNHAKRSRRKKRRNTVRTGTGSTAMTAISILALCAATALQANDAPPGSEKHSAAVRASTDPVTLYNLGNERYRARAYEEAISLYREALDNVPVVEGRNSSEWLEVCARINYNLATASLALANAMPPVPMLKIPELESAVEIYRRLLANGKLHRETAVNLEIALLELEKMRQAARNSRQNGNKGQNDNGNSESDSGQQQDDGEPSDDSDSSKQPATASAYIVDQNNKTLPPPTESPEDIMRMEDALTKKRKTSNKGKQKGKTEMDW